MLFDANKLARGWLSVALASGKDENTPVLDRAVYVEQHAHGVFLTATNRFILLRTWVPSLEASLSWDDLQAPLFDEAPVTVAIARDVYARGRGLFAHLWSLTLGAEDDDTAVEVRLRVTDAVDLPAGALDIEGLEPRNVIIEHPDHERVILPVHEGTWPNWRALTVEHHVKATRVVALNTERLKELAQLGKYHSGALLWRFGGSDKPALVEVADSDPRVSGVVMPEKWVWEVPEEEEPAA